MEEWYKWLSSRIKCVIPAAWPLWTHWNIKCHLNPLWWCKDFNSFTKCILCHTASDTMYCYIQVFTIQQVSPGETSFPPTNESLIVKHSFCNLIIQKNLERILWQCFVINPGCQLVWIENLWISNGDCWHTNIHQFYIPFRLGCMSPS